MRWFITGGCGFIGCGLVARLVGEGGHAIRIYDNLSVGTSDDLSRVTTFARGNPDDWDDWSDQVRLIEADILDAEFASVALSGADVVIHLAANTGVGPSVADPTSDCRTNVLGTLNILEASRKAKVERFVFASSGAPLGVQVPPLHEEMAPHPASPYGASKLSGEGYCSAYYHSFGLETVVLRFGNVYGEGSAHKNSVIAKFIKEALAGEKLEIYGDGSQTRDFIHISDLIEAIWCAATSTGVGGECFQIATATETTVAQMTDKMFEAFRDQGIEPPKTFLGPFRNGDVMRNYSDTSKAKARLGWQARVTLEEGLQRTLRHFLGEANDIEMQERRQ